MDNIIERLQEDIRLRGLSTSTEEEYINRVNAFLHWAGKPAEDMDEQNIRQFLKYLINERQLSVSSVNTHNSALRFLYAVTLNRNLNYRQIPRLKQIQCKGELKFYGKQEYLTNGLNFQNLLSSLYQKEWVVCG